MATSVSTIGIDVTPLVQTIEAIEHDSSLASFTFRPQTSWQERIPSQATRTCRRRRRCGTRSRVRFR
jgi:hypothetical protein